MQDLQRRLYYPLLQLREGGIRRTSYRRAARLDAMLKDRATRAGQLHRLLLVVRGLSDAVTQGGFESGAVMDNVAPPQLNSTSLSSSLLPSSSSSSAVPAPPTPGASSSEQQQQQRQAREQGHSDAPSPPSDAAIANAISGMKMRGHAATAATARQQPRRGSARIEADHESWSALSPAYMQCLGKVEQQAWDILHDILDCTETYLKPCHTPSGGNMARKGGTGAVAPPSTGSDPSAKRKAHKKYSGILGDQFRRGAFDIGLRGSIFFGRQTSVEAPEEEEEEEEEAWDSSSGGGADGGRGAGKSAAKSSFLGGAAGVWSIAEEHSPGQDAEESALVQDSQTGDGEGALFRRRIETAAAEVSTEGKPGLAAKSQPLWQGPGPDAGGGGGSGRGNSGGSGGDGGSSSSSEDVGTGITNGADPSDGDHGEAAETALPPSIRTDLTSSKAFTLHTLPPSPYPESSNMKRFAQLLDPRTGLQLEGVERPRPPPPPPAMSPRTHHHPLFHKSSGEAAGVDADYGGDLQRASTPQHHQWQPLQQNSRAQNRQQSMDGIQALKDSLQELAPTAKHTGPRSSGIETGAVMLDTDAGSAASAESGAESSSVRRASAGNASSRTPMSPESEQEDERAPELVWEHRPSEATVRGNAQAQSDLLKLANRAMSHTRAAPLATAEMMGTAAPPSKYTRLWPWYAFYGVVLAGIGLWGWRNNKTVNELLT